MSKSPPVPQNIDHLHTLNDAENITPDTAKRYQQMADQLTEDQRRSLRKFELADWKVITPDQLTLEEIKRDREGMRRKALEKLEMQAFPQIAEALDQISLDRYRNNDLPKRLVTRHTLRVNALESIGVGAVLESVFSGVEWSTHSEIVQTTVEHLRAQRDELKKMGVGLFCGVDASNNGYFGALLKFFDLETKRNRRRNTYQLCPKDWVFTKADLMARLPRNIEKFGDLSINSDNAWARWIYE